MGYSFFSTIWDHLFYFFLGVLGRRILVTELFVVSDRIYYNATEQTMTRSSSAEYFEVIDNDLSVALPSAFEVSFDLDCSNKQGLAISSKANKPNYGGLTFKEGDKLYSALRTTTTNLLTNASIGSGYHTVVMTYENGTLSFKVDGASWGSTSTSLFSSYSDFTFVWWSWGTGTTKAKNLSIKPL